MKTTDMLNRSLKFAISSFILVTPTSCSDFIELEAPKTEIVSQSVFSSDGSAASAIRGIYSLMMTNFSFTGGALEELTGIASDELINYSIRADQLQFAQNSLTPRNGDVFAAFWKEPYRYINNANVLLEGLHQSTGMSAAGKNQVEGEAKFIRAFCHFYLANLFGDVPYVTSSDYQANAKAPREAFDEVMSKIVVDLLEARELLSGDFSASKGERIQPNKGAATALLARLYLYRGNWEKAEAMASDLIVNTTTYGLLAELDGVFLANSREAIWQLKPVIPGTNSPQGQTFILRNEPNGISGRVSMTADLTEAFEINDQRKTKWVGTFTSTGGTWTFIHKYKTGNSPTLSEYSMVMRLAEQYLIRAEARAQLGNIEGSASDLNAIRSRAGLPNTEANDKDALLAAIERERRVELFGESGHRWLDLKRTGRADAVLGTVKPGWEHSDQLLPIPDSERLLNPNLSQNPGY